MTETNLPSFIGRKKPFNAATATIEEIADRHAGLPQQPTDDQRVSTAIVRYCDAAADEIEKEVARANERVAKFTEDALKTAANLRQLGQMQCDHILKFSATVKGAVDSMRETSASLVNYMTTPTVHAPRIDTVEAVAKELNGGGATAE
jgi:hypothetical protein